MASSSSSYSRPTSAPSSALDTPSSSSVNMTRSSSSEQGKVSKRKGTRSVSTLTPAQLARKRANDREAQRAIRARTKEHIERLESELDELRGRHSRDHTVQDLLRRNRALEDELNRLRDSMGVSVHSSPYVKPIYDDNMSTRPGNFPSPRTSPYPAGGDYVVAATTANGQLSDYGQAGYVHFPPSCEAWAATIPATASGNPSGAPSNVSSPSTSSVGPDDFAATGGAGSHFLPTSAPMMSSSSLNLRGGAEEIKMEYEDGNDHGFPLDRSPSCGSSASGTSPMPNTHNLLHPGSFMPQHHHHHQQAPTTAPWNMYPMFYPVQSPVH